MKVAVKALRIARLGRFKIEDIPVREEQREHRPRPINANRNARLPSGIQQPLLESRAQLFHCRVWLFLLQTPQCCKTGSDS
jgi:hypothetical protein